MHPCTPQQVNHHRSIAVSIIRTAGASLLVWGAYLMLKRILFGIAQRSVEMAFTVYEGVGEEHSFYRGLSLTVVAVLLACFADRIAGGWCPCRSTGVPGAGTRRSAPIGAPNAAWAGSVRPRRRDSLRARCNAVPDNRCSRVPVRPRV